MFTSVSHKRIGGVLCALVALGCSVAWYAFSSVGERPLPLTLDSRTRLASSADVVLATIADDGSGINARSKADGPQRKQKMDFPPLDFDLAAYFGGAKLIAETERNAARNDVNAMRELYAAYSFCDSLSPRRGAVMSEALNSQEASLTREACFLRIFGRQYSADEAATAKLDLARRVAQSGDPSAQVFFSSMVLGGEYAAQLSSQHDATAMTSLALALLLDAAAANHAHANARLAEMYLRGTGVPVDRRLAKSFAQRAMETGDYPNLVQQLGLD